jgi:ABC-type Zn2+ transport system substrate-binding protein/surface adhesin
VRVGGADAPDDIDDIDGKLQKLLDERDRYQLKLEDVEEKVCLALRTHTHTRTRTRTHTHTHTHTHARTHTHTHRRKIWSQVDRM